MGNLETANAANGSTGSSFNHTATGNSDRLVAILVGIDDNSTPSSVTYGGVNCTLARSETRTGAGGVGCSVWYIKDANIGSAGTKAVVVNGVGTSGKVYVIEANGVVQTGGGRNGGTNQGSGSSISIAQGVFDTSFDYVNFTAACFQSPQAVTPDVDSQGVDVDVDYTSPPTGDQLTVGVKVLQPSSGTINSSVSSDSASSLGRACMVGSAWQFIPPEVHNTFFGWGTF